MQQVTSIKEIETVINKNGEMIIGKNNKNNVIVMSMDEYRNNIFDGETIKCLLKSEEDIENDDRSLAEYRDKMLIEILKLHKKI